MSNYETLLLEKEDYIGTIILNRPERLNAFNARMRGEFPRAMQEMAVDPEVRVVVVTGAGDAFIGGLAYALAQGNGMEQAIEFANCTAALSVTKLGTQVSFPTLAEVQDFQNAQVKT